MLYVSVNINGTRYLQEWNPETATLLGADIAHRHGVEIEILRYERQDNE